MCCVNPTVMWSHVIMGSADERVLIALLKQREPRSNNDEKPLHIKPSFTLSEQFLSFVYTTETTQQLWKSISLFFTYFQVFPTFSFENSVVYEDNWFYFFIWCHAHTRKLVYVFLHKSLDKNLKNKTNSSKIESTKAASIKLTKGNEFF